jgi:ankyrin repeat protein
MALTDDEFIELVKTNRENENSNSDGFKEIEKALHNGANVNSNSNFHGTPLHIAAKSGNIPLMTLLVEKGADINNNKPGISGHQYTPLYYVIVEIIEDKKNNYSNLREKRFEAVKFLLEQKEIDVNKENNEWKTVLDETATNDEYELTKLLLDKRAEPKQVLDYSANIEHNNNTKVFDNMLNLLIEYAVRDPKYKPSKNAHQRVKDMYAVYKKEQKEKRILVDKLDEPTIGTNGNVINKSYLGPNVKDSIREYAGIGGKRKSKKTKAKKAAKYKAKTNRKKRSTKKSNKSKR